LVRHPLPPPPPPSFPSPPLFRSGSPVVSYPEEPPPYHPCHVGIYGWHGLLVCERCNGAGGIRSDSRELDELIRLTWQRGVVASRSEEHTSELQSLRHLVCRLLLE